MEPQDETKLIFGLSPRSTIINAFILTFISQLFWVLKFVQQIPTGADFNTVKITDNVPWYYDMPIILLAMFMALRWVEYSFKIDRKDYSWRAIRYKYIYLIGITMLVEAIAKFIFLIIIL